MDELLEQLRSQAQTRFGPERLAALESILRDVARDLVEITQYSLEPDDVP